MNSVLLARAINLVRAFIDLVSFSMGIGFRITLDSFEDPNGVVGVLQQIMADVSNICTAYTFPPKNQSENADFCKGITSSYYRAEPSWKHDRSCGFSSALASNSHKLRASIGQPEKGRCARPEASEGMGGATADR